MRWRLGHRPALDGLRGVAVLLVVAFHGTNADLFPSGGIVGVIAFFTLSGFLITSLLLEEHGDTGRLRFGAFYRRRALRLFPALALMLVVLGPYALATDNIEPAQFAAVVFYAANWAVVDGQLLGMFAHTWTLATEEQFYLVWPVALLALVRVPQGVLVAAALGVVLAVVGALGALMGVVALLVGCALAVHLHDRPAPKPLPVYAVPGFLVALLACASVTGSATAVVLVATAVSTGLVYTIAATDTVLLLTAPWLRAVGKRSYGVYLWHLPLLIIGTELMAGRIGFYPSVVLTLPILALVVELSWRYVEQPCLRLKDRQAAAAWAAIRAPDSPVP